MICFLNTVIGIFVPSLFFCVFLRIEITPGVWVSTTNKTEAEILLARQSELEENFASENSEKNDQNPTNDLESKRNEASCKDELFCRGMCSTG